jgi:hypothetical protein
MVEEATLPSVGTGVMGGCICPPLARFPGLVV